jgi:hypothetical protein
MWEMVLFIGVIALSVFLIIYGIMVWGRPNDEKCDPKCRSDQTCKNKKCVSNCDPKCASNEMCKNKKCVSNCDPECVPGESCTDDGTCVSNCDPKCAPGESCTDDGTCVKDCNMSSGCPNKPRLCLPFKNTGGTLSTTTECDKDYTKCNIQIGCYDKTKTQWTKKGGYGIDGKIVRDKPNSVISQAVANCNFAASWTKAGRTVLCT